MLSIWWLSATRIFALKPAVTRFDVCSSWAPLLFATCIHEFVLSHTFDTGAGSNLELCVDLRHWLSACYCHESIRDGECRLLRLAPKSWRVQTTCCLCLHPSLTTPSPSKLKCLLHVFSALFQCSQPSVQPYSRLLWLSKPSWSRGRACLRDGVGRIAVSLVIRSWDDLY